MDGVKVIDIQMINGRPCITTDALGYCNTKYHPPYLAVIDGFGAFIFQDREFVGYGKHRNTYYVVDNLGEGDIIRAAGGSGSNKYPHSARVISIDLEGMKLKVKKLSNKEFGNVVRPRKRLSRENEMSMLGLKIARLEIELKEARDRLAELEDEEKEDD